MKIIQIAVVQSYEGDAEYAGHPSTIIGLSDEGKIYKLRDNKWILIK